VRQVTGRIEVVKEIVARDWLPHDDALSTIRPREGQHGISTFVQIYRDAFPDLTFAIEALVTLGDTVIARWIASGTHKGDLEDRWAAAGDLPATNQQHVEARGTSINRIVEGQIKGNEFYWEGSAYSNVWRSTRLEAPNTTGRGWGRRDRWRWAPRTSTPSVVMLVLLSFPASGSMGTSPV
jgi:predicted ester cyclase